MKRLSVFEIALSGVILSIAITAKYFDRFIPHVHPLHIVVLLIGISIMRFRVSIILVPVYIGLKIMLFGPGGITPFMISMHVISDLSLLLMATVKLFDKKEYIVWKQTILISSIIIIVMLIFLVFVVIGDTDYSPKELPFSKKIWLNLIYPGDWMNVTITTVFSLVLVPPTYFIFQKMLKRKLDVSVW